MENARDLGIYSEVPFLDKVQRGLTAALAALFANRVALFLWDIVFIVFMSAIVSHEARASSASRSFRMILLTLLLTVFVAWGVVLWRFVGPLVERLAFGLPVFGQLGGLPSRTFFTAMKCACAIDYTFRPDEQQTAKRFCEVDRELVKQTLGLKFQAVSVQSPSLPPFDEVWNDKILKLWAMVSPSRFVTYGDLISSSNIGMTIEAPRLISVSQLVAPLIKIIEMIMVFLLARFLDGHVSLLTVIQVGLFLDLSLSLVLFNYHAHQSSEFPISFLVQADLTEDLKENIKALAGRVLHPKKITMRTGYLSLIQGYFSALVVSGGLLNALSMFLLVGIVLGLSYLWRPASFGAILPWYEHFSLGLLLVTAGLILAYHLMFLILRNFKTLLAPIVGGVIAVAVPYACIYLAGGHVDFTQAKNNLVAVFTGAGTILATVIASRVKKVMGSDGEEKGKDEEKKDTAGELV